VPTSVVTLSMAPVDSDCTDCRVLARLMVIPACLLSASGKGMVVGKPALGVVSTAPGKGCEGGGDAAATRGPGAKSGNLDSALRMELLKRRTPMIVCKAAMSSIHSSRAMCVVRCLSCACKASELAPSK